MKVRTALVLCALGLLMLPLVLCTGCGKQEKQRGIMNVSYDPTRELYSEYNEMFAEHWKNKTGESIIVEKSNAGSRAQSRSVQSGMPADVVTLAIAIDIDDIAKAKVPGSEETLMNPAWQKQFPNNSCPYTSTIVILVRKGNPKQIKDWDDLAKEGVRIITPNPKTSGGACWNYLAIWGYALEKELSSAGGFAALKDPSKAEQVKAAQEKAFQFTKSIFKNALAQGMPTGARDATDEFVKRGNGDVFLAWENEAILSKQVKEEEGLEIIVPSVSIKAEPPVAIVDANVKAHNNRDIAEEYLNYLYDPACQEVIARHHFRPSNEEVAKKHLSKYPALRVFSIDEVFGGWGAAQKVHFNADGTFDRMMNELSK